MSTLASICLSLLLMMPLPPPTTPQAVALAFLEARHADDGYDVRLSLKRKNPLFTPRRQKQLASRQAGLLKSLRATHPNQPAKKATRRPARKVTQTQQRPDGVWVTVDSETRIELRRFAVGWRVTRIQHLHGCEGWCQGCAGSGELGWGKTSKPCGECAGAGKCKACAADRWLPWEQVGPALWSALVKPGQLLCAVPPSLASADLSSPKGAGLVFLRTRLERFVGLEGALAAKLRKLSRFYAPQVEATCLAKLDAAVKASAKQAADLPNKIRVVESKTGDKAEVALRCPPLESGKLRSLRLRLVKLEGAWRVENLERDCGNCSGNKVCRACKGTGTAEGERCWLCVGKGGCAPCKGSGRAWLFSRAD